MRRDPNQLDPTGELDNAEFIRANAGIVELPAGVFFIGEDYDDEGCPVCKGGQGVACYGCMM